MGASRVSNKDILDAINGIGPSIVEALRDVALAQAPATVQAASVPETGKPSINVSKEYLANRKVAAQAHANKVGTEVVLYARTNLQNETKLAFAIADRYAVLKDRGLIGEVKRYSPE